MLSTSEIIEMPSRVPSPLSSSLLSSMPLDQAVGRAAAGQHGLVTSPQLKAIGVTRAALRTRLARGQWVKVENGVFRVEGAPVTWQSELLACVLAAGGAALASHRSAAALWGLEGYSRSGKPELVVPRSRRLRRPGAVVHRSSDLHLVEPVRRDGIPTTPVARTLLDLGAVQGRRQVQAAVDDARRRGLVEGGELVEVLVAHARRGRDGVAKLRWALERDGGGAGVGSTAEHLLRVRLVEAGLPAPQVRYEVLTERGVCRVDLAYPVDKVAIRLEEGPRRAGSAGVGEQDGSRALVDAGWQVLRFTWGQYRRSPGEVVGAVRSALGSAVRRGRA